MRRTRLYSGIHRSSANPSPVFQHVNPNPGAGSTSAPVTYALTVSDSGQFASIPNTVNPASAPANRNIRTLICWNSRVVCLALGPVERRHLSLVSVVQDLNDLRKCPPQDHGIRRLLPSAMPGVSGPSQHSGAFCLAANRTCISTLGPSGFYPRSIASGIGPQSALY